MALDLSLSLSSSLPPLLVEWIIELQLKIVWGVGSSQVAKGSLASLKKDLEIKCYFKNLFK